eukprot:TRINITY_DN43224_c0_g1_i1.p1 TRINITY_DN43224_c0_g1~~TRINITY_DN43224_c0_g1_i1.p1  ORF type:complete len:432 (-),score=63.45 TRINITY_DN43224_c0_g1_i1:133-1428(-)
MIRHTRGFLGGSRPSSLAALFVGVLVSSTTQRTAAARSRALRASSWSSSGALQQLNVKSVGASVDFIDGYDAGAAGTCDMTSLGGTVCYADHRALLMPPAVVRGLVGRYTFDEPAALDSSGNAHHGSQIIHGPSPAGSGHSAFFQRTFVTLPNSAHLQAEDFSYSLWVYIIEEDDGVGADHAPQWCPLLRKGVHVPEAREFSSSPALLYSHGTGQLRASVTTSLHPASMDGEHVDSNARLLPNRWMHLAIVHHKSKLLLYVNGILDSATTLRGNALPNAHPLYVGGDPFTTQYCEHAVYMDELRIYNTALLPHELQAEGAMALGGADPSFVHLGCTSCDVLQAARSCPANRHVCSSLELHTGAYQVARALGWLRFGAHVWTLAAAHQAQQQPQITGLVPAAAATAALGSHVGPTLGSPTVGLGLCCSGASP